MTDAEVVADAEQEWRLRDRRDFLRRSLDDAEREHDAGDLDEEDYRVLRRRDERRLAEVEAALSRSSTRAGSDETAGGPVRRAGAGSTGAPPPADGVSGVPGSAAALADRPPRRRWRWRRRGWLAVGGAVCLAAAAVLLVVELTSTRLPGESATGSIDLNTAQQIERQLTQAQTLANEGKPSQALRLYGDVLTEDPKDPVALAEWGWLDWQAATAAKSATVAAEGASALVESVKLDGRLFAAQYYLGTILLEEGDAAKAVTHYAAFLADGPTAKWLDDAAPSIRAAYAAVGRPAPSGLPDPASPGSTPPAAGR